jgi:hypothetical protein
VRAISDCRGNQSVGRPRCSPEPRAPQRLGIAWSGPNGWGNRPQFVGHQRVDVGAFVVPVRLGVQPVFIRPTTFTRCSISSQSRSGRGRQGCTGRSWRSRSSSLAAAQLRRPQESSSSSLEFSSLVPLQEAMTSAGTAGPNEQPVQPRVPPAPDAMRSGRLLVDYPCLLTDLL